MSWKREASDQIFQEYLSLFLFLKLFLFSLFLAIFQISFLETSEKTIAVGTFGVVSIVAQISSERKLVWKKIGFVEGNEDRITPEVEIGKEMNCSWIVSILNTFFDKQSLFIVMLFFQKGNLKELWDKFMKRRKTIDEEVFFFLFVCFSYSASFSLIVFS
jgi:serine/threonine protein kinase